MLFFSLGLSRSISGWAKTRESISLELIKEELEELYQKEEEFSIQAIENSIAPYLNRLSWLFVFDDTEEILYSYRKSGSGGGGQGQGRGEGRNFFLRHAEDLDKLPLKNENRLIGYVSAGTENFIEDTANQRFLSLMLQSMILGGVTAFCLALIISYFFSRKISGQTNVVRQGLSELTKGRRDVEFLIKGPRELVEIGESAKELQERLEREESLRRQWAADVAHDLRTPITAVKVQIEGLMDGVLPPGRDRYEKIHEEIKRIDLLVEDLSHLTKIESPEFTIHRENIPTEELLAILKDRFLPIAEERGISLFFISDLSYLHVDRELLLRGVSNILLNGIMYSQEGGTVECVITEESESKEQCIKVTNTGYIEESELPLLFDRLHRGESSRFSPGTGLGLTISKAIAEAHSGSLVVYNTGNRTVTVELRLPPEFDIPG